MSKGKYWGKIVYAGEGVCFEKAFKTKAEAEAFCLGFDKARDELDEEELFEDYYACVGTEAAKDERRNATFHFRR